MTRVLIFRHVPFEGPGSIQPILESRSIECHVGGAFDLPMKPEAADALIFMGGPMSVNDDLDFLRAEEEIIRGAIGRGQPVLGICLGSQLIARALGATVRRNHVKEIGWFPVQLTEAAATDPLFSAFEEGETVFHWHGETWELPPGATLLASSERCRHQAFRLGNNVYGFQFHPEITPAMIEDWCRQDANCGDTCELSEPLDPHQNAARVSVLAHNLFTLWCDTV